MPVGNRTAPRVGLAWIALALSACLTVNVTEGGGAGSDAGTSDGVSPGPDAQDADASDGAPPSGPGEDFATGQQTPGDLVIDATTVYWMNGASGGNGGSIMKAPKKRDPGPPAIVVNGLPGPVGMTGDATTLYWIDPTASNSGIEKHDKAGGGTSILGLAGGSTGPVVQAGALYWCDGQYNGEVQTALIDFTTHTTLQQNLGDVKVLTVDAVNVYVAKTGQILVLPKSGGSPMLFANTAGVVQGITADATTVYWVDTSNVSSLAKTKVGGAPNVLAAGQNGPSSLAIDDANVYWTTTGDGKVQSVPKAGGAPTTLASGEGEPHRIAVDPAGVFWSNRADGRVRVVWR